MLLPARSSEPREPETPPTGIEEFQAEGVLGTLWGTETPTEEVQVVRDLSEQETSALRFFIAEGEYREYRLEDMSADFVNIPVVKIDNVWWWVYESGLFQVADGVKSRRKEVKGVTITLLREGYWRRGDPLLDFSGLLKWYEANK